MLFFSSASFPSGDSVSPSVAGGAVGKGSVGCVADVSTSQTIDVDSITAAIPVESDSATAAVVVIGDNGASCTEAVIVDVGASVSAVDVFAPVSVGVIGASLTAAVSRAILIVSDSGACF